jgi:hypothetical protein
MIEINTPETVEGEEVEMIELFSLGEKVYEIPNVENSAISLQYLTVVRKQGLGIAESWLGEAMLGEDAWADLLSYPGITGPQIHQVLSAARAIAFGELKPGPKEKAAKSTGPRSTATKTKRSKDSSSSVPG